MVHIVNFWAELDSIILIIPCRQFLFVDDTVVASDVWCYLFKLKRRLWASISWERRKNAKLACSASASTWSAGVPAWVRNFFNSDLSIVPLPSASTFLKNSSTRAGKTWLSNLTLLKKLRAMCHHWGALVTSFCGLLQTGNRKPGPARPAAGLTHHQLRLLIMTHTTRGLI